MKFIRPIIISLLLLALCSQSWAMEQKRGLIFTVDQKTLDPSLNYIWDNFRASRVQWMTRDMYDNVYYAIGEQCRDNLYMKNLWQRAIKENDTLDYLSFVHGGDQWIKPEWEANCENKLRMVYSEGCNGGSGKEEFIINNGAVLSVGHSKASDFPSASPFFSFRFLESWLSGKSFKESLENAWSEGKETLSSKPWFKIAEIFGGYTCPEEAFSGSRIEYAHLENVNPDNFTIFTPCAGIVRCDKVIEREVNDL